MGVPEGSRVSRTPSFHMVNLSSAIGSFDGARSRNKAIAGMGVAMTAPMSELRTRLRRVNPDSAFASRKIATAPSRVSSLPRVGWRSSVSSWPCMSAFDQCTAPMPTPKRPSVMPMPRNMLFKRIEPGSRLSIGKRMYAATAITLPTIERKNSALMVRSACFSFFGSRSVTRSLSGGNPGLDMRSVRTTAMAGAGAE